MNGIHEENDITQLLSKYHLIPETFVWKSRCSSLARQRRAARRAAMFAFAFACFVIGYGAYYRDRVSPLQTIGVSAVCTLLGAIAFMTPARAVRGEVKFAVAGPLGVLLFWFEGSIPAGGFIAWQRLRYMIVSCHSGTHSTLILVTNRKTWLRVELDRCYYVGVAWELGDISDVEGLLAQARKSGVSWKETKCRDGRSKIISITTAN